MRSTEPELFAPADTPPAADAGPALRASALCVLASGSSGNCAALRAERSDGRSIVLIDAGLSPRRTRRLLAARGIGWDEIAAVVLTHLDHDHFHRGWVRALPDAAAFHVHARHAPAAAGWGLGARGGPRMVEFEGPFDPTPGLHADPMLMDHDEHGVVSLRLEMRRGGTLGYATDLGRVTRRLVGHLRGVDVLAIESNYCPRLQVASDRPDALKRRIMGGSGHLSNAEAADAALQIAPGHVVLLHLSRHCNTVALAAGAHTGRPYAVTVSTQSDPTGWIPVP